MQPITTEKYRILSPGTYFETWLKNASGRVDFIESHGIDIAFLTEMHMPQINLDRLTKEQIRFLLYALEVGGSRSATEESFYHISTGLCSFIPRMLRELSETRPAYKNFLDYFWNYMVCGRPIEGMLELGRMMPVRTAASIKGSVYLSGWLQANNSHFAEMFKNGIEAFSSHEHDLYRGIRLLWLDDIIPQLHDALVK